jgi:medium-chain acyl-[acyl-carrier-protein] hydrolase
MFSFASGVTESGPPLARIFPFRRKAEQPRLRLLCFPYAGGSAALYRPWVQQLAPAIDVCPVELPGHGLRFAEPAARDMRSLCDGLAPAIAQLCDGVSLAVFGHSMGARVAFEIARRFARDVVQLFASASAAPGERVNHDLPSRSRPTSQLTDAEFRQRLGELGGTPPEILAEDDVMNRILPVVRADFLLIEHYQVDPLARVVCPITAFAGRDDASASPAAMAAWQPRTTAAFRLVELDAGHFFLDSRRAVLLDEIVRDLAPRFA